VKRETDIYNTAFLSKWHFGEESVGSRRGLWLSRRISSKLWARAAPCFRVFCSTSQGTPLDFIFLIVLSRQIEVGPRPLEYHLQSGSIWSIISKVEYHLQSGSIWSIQSGSIWSIISKVEYHLQSESIWSIISKMPL